MSGSAKQKSEPHEYVRRRWADAEISQRKWQSWPIVALPTETSAAVRKGEDGCLYLWVASSAKKVCIKKVKFSESQQPIPPLVDDWLRSAWSGSSRVPALSAERAQQDLEMNR
jgi:hypothetical protein